MPKMILNNLENTRKTLSRLIREFSKIKNTKHFAFHTSKHKTLLYGFSCYLAYLKTETDTELLLRIEAIEKKIEDKKI